MYKSIMKSRKKEQIVHSKARNMICRVINKCDKKLQNISSY